MSGILCTLQWGNTTQNDAYCESLTHCLFVEYLQQKSKMSVKQEDEPKKKTESTDEIEKNQERSNLMQMWHRMQELETQVT